MCDIYQKRSKTSNGEEKAASNDTKGKLNDPSKTASLLEESKWEFSLVPLEDVEIQAQILCSLQFFATDISSLTCLHLQTPDDDEETDEKGRPRPAASFTELEKDYGALINAYSRMASLTQLYSKLLPSWLKAKVAYALGLHAIFVLDDFKMAEQLFFECLYILDNIRPPSSSLACIVSQLGINALLRYGEVLLTNFKYPYAIGSFNSAVMNADIRKRSDYFSLLRRIAQYSKDNDDNNRAINFFQRILEIYETQENKDNEVRLVLTTLSGLQLEIGEFKKAEKALGRAILSMPEPTSERIDPLNFKLQIKLVDLYLDSYHIEKAIQLLDALHNSFLPPGTNSRQVVLGKLAKIYTKMNWFDRASEILDGFEYELTHTNQTQLKTPQPLPTGGTVGRRQQIPDQQKALQFWELSAINYYHSGHFNEAVHCIDNAINLCPITSISSLAYYYFRRGRIFQSLCAAGNSIQFPTTLRPEKDITPNQKRENQKIFNCTGDFVQECVASYNRAYSYFKVIGDDIHIAKTVNNIATTLLEHVFPPVALLGLPYDSVARLNFSEPSELAKVGPIPKRSNPNQPITTHRRADSTASGHKRSESADTLHQRSDSTDSHKSSKSEEGSEYYISFEKIENPAVCGLEICAETLNIVALTQSHLNMAEIRYLQREVDTAVAFWKEARDQLLQLFMDGETFLGKQAPPNFLRKILNYFKRLIRFMFCFDKDFINENIILFEAYLLLQIYLDQSLNRPMTILKSQTTDQRTARTVSFGKSTKKSGSYGSGNGTGSSSGVPSTSRTRTPVQRIFSDSVHNFEGEKSKESKEPEEAEKIDEITEDFAERIWGYLYAVKVQIKKYGKLQSEELLYRNRKIFDKVFTIKRSLEVMKRQSDNINLRKDWKKSTMKLSLPPEVDKITFTYSELLKENPQLEKLMYVLQMDHFILYYVPNSGKKRVQVLGGKEEQLSQNNNNSQANNILLLSIHPLANSEEYVTLEVSPLLTFDRLLKYLCNKPYWEEAKTRRKTVNLFGTFRENKTTSATTLKTKPKFVDQSALFMEELEKLKTNLISLLPKDTTPPKSRVLSPAELSLISFAKKNIDRADQSSSDFNSISVSLSTTIAQCFTNQELKECNPNNPLKLFLYLSSNNASGLNGSLNYAFNTIYFSDEILNYFKTLIQAPKDVNPDNSEKILTDISENMFSSISDIVPYTSEDTRSKVMPKNGPEVSYCPLTLICSKSFQIFPWELMFGECLVRQYSVQDIMLAFRKRKLFVDVPLPYYYAFYNSAGDRGVIPFEETRRLDRLSKTIDSSLNLKTQELPTIRQIAPVTPFHCLLLKNGRKVKDMKKKYKRIGWIDNYTNVSKIGKVLERQSMTGFPVFLLSYADLIEAPSSLLEIIRTHTECTFLFVPATKLKEVTIRFHKIQDEYSKPINPKKGNIQPQPEGRYHFLMQMITKLELELMTPIVVMNSPPHNTF